MNHFAKTVLVHASDEPMVNDVFPDREAWARSPPRFHDIGVWPWLSGDPLDEIGHKRRVLNCPGVPIDRHGPMLHPPPHLVHPYWLLENRVIIVIPSPFVACCPRGAAMTEYVFDNKEAETEQRFGALEALFDPVSKRHLEPHVVPGAHCLEVGGGSGSIALWMSERVGERGRVVVTDINTRFLDGIAGPNIEVRQHDIVSDPLEEAAFDVAHTRLVLLHIPERKRALERMIAAVKPGGWLVLEEFDS